MDCWGMGSPLRSIPFLEDKVVVMRMVGTTLYII